MSGRLSQRDIGAALHDLPGWTCVGDALTNAFDCKDFDGSIRFVNAIATEANRLNHHPDIAISWNTVTIRTWSHDTGGITERDVVLARAIERLT